MNEEEVAAEGGDEVGLEVDMETTKVFISFRLISSNSCKLAILAIYLVYMPMFFLYSCCLMEYFFTDNGGYPNWGRGGGRGGWSYNGLCLSFQNLDILLLSICFEIQCFVLFLWSHIFSNMLLLLNIITIYLLLVVFISRISIYY